MLIGNKITPTNPAFEPAWNFLKVNLKLRTRFQKTGSELSRQQDDTAPHMVFSFVADLVRRADPGELVEFAFIHDQERLYRTLRHFIWTCFYNPALTGAPLEAFLDVAAQFLTEAYCQYHEPDNMRHRNNIWSYNLSLQLMPVFRPFERKPEEISQPAQEPPKQ